MEEVGVVYTTKELLERIDNRFERLEGAVSGLVHREEFNAVVGRVSVLEQDSLGTKAVASALLANKNHRFTRNEKIVGAVFGIATVILNIMALAPDII